MSLITFDPLFGTSLMRPTRRGWGGATMGLLDTFFNDMNAPQLRDHSAKLSLGKNGEFSYKVSFKALKCMSKLCFCQYYTHFLINGGFYRSTLPAFVQRK